MVTAMLSNWLDKHVYTCMVIHIHMSPMMFKLESHEHPLDARKCLKQRNDRVERVRDRGMKLKLIGLMQKTSTENVLLLIPLINVYHIPSNDVKCLCTRF